MSTQQSSTTTAAAPTPVPTTGPRPARGSVLPAVERYALLGFTLLLFLAFSTWPRTSEIFPTVANLRNITGNQSVVAVVALAAMVPLVCGQFDVSVGATLGLGQVAAASALSAHHLPLPVAALVALLLCAAVGAVNGLLIAYLAVNPLIVTLGMATLVGGLVSYYTHNEAIVNGIPAVVSSIGSQNLLGVPQTTWLLLLVAVAVAWTLRQTPYGRHLTAVGSSPSAARLVGLPVRRLVFTTFVIASVLAGLAGLLQLTRTGTANPAIGPGYTLPALSAAFLGATAIRPGRFNVLGTLIGVAFVAISVNGLVLAGAADWVDPVFNGSALILAVTMSTALGRRRRGTS